MADLTDEALATLLATNEACDDFDPDYSPSWEGACPTCAHGERPHNERKALLELQARRAADREYAAARGEFKEYRLGTDAAWDDRLERLAQAEEVICRLALGQREEE